MINVSPSRKRSSAVANGFYSEKQAGVRSFIITFDVYVIPNIFEKYDNKRPDPICRMPSIKRGVRSQFIALSVTRFLMFAVYFFSNRIGSRPVNEKYPKRYAPYGAKTKRTQALVMDRI